MAEVNVYYVPEDQSRFAGTVAAVADAFFDSGVLLVNECIRLRVRDWQRRGGELPPCAVDFEFADMGFYDDVPTPIPLEVCYDLPFTCPYCGAGCVGDEVEDLLSRSPRKPEDWVVFCPGDWGGCDLELAFVDLHANQPFTLARRYLWLSGVDPDDLEGFQKNVEQVLGPCRVYIHHLVT